MPEEDSKPVKKEEPEDEEFLSALANRKRKSPNNSNATPKLHPKVKKEQNKVKKEEADDDFEKPASNKAPKMIDTKGQKKKKKAEEAQKTKKGSKAAESKVAMKKEKKVFDLPGQKRDPPEERDALRIFYESLYKQMPSSEMAAIWMMESGLLPKEDAKKVFERKQKKARQQKLSSPMKTVVTVKKRGENISIEKKTSKSPVSTQKTKTPDTKAAAASKQKSKKRKSKDDGSSGDDDDFVLASRKFKKLKA